jgi:hypothetical protein
MSIIQNRRTKMQGLVLQDLKVAAGAIELGAIGDVYDKLTTFIKSAEPPAPAADETTEGGEGAEVTETGDTTPVDGTN